MSITFRRAAEVSILVLIVLARTTFAGIGPNSRIPAIFISPSPSLPPISACKLHIETQQGAAWAGVQVSLEFPEEACDLLVLCGSSYSSCPHTYTQTTDSNGDAYFFISGGGCWGSGYVATGGAWVNETLPAGYLIKVYVGTELVGLRGVRSGDAVDATPKISTQLWCESPPNVPGLAKTTLSDAIYHTNPIRRGSLSDPCSDIDGNGVCSLTDGVLITPAIRTGWTCSESSN